MSEPQVSLDAATLSPVEQKLQGALEDQLTSALQAAADTITSAYAGQNADQVTAMLLAETKAGLHPDIAAGWVPDQRQLHQVAEQIVRSGS
jgi:hypothetical protein